MRAREKNREYKKGRNRKSEEERRRGRILVDEGGRLWNRNEMKGTE